MFENTEFTLPENYLPDNDPYADDWAKLSPEDRKNLPYWMKGYYSMAEKDDEEVGRMLAAIKKAGLEDDTIFVFRPRRAFRSTRKTREKHILRRSGESAVPREISRKAAKR